MKREQNECQSVNTDIKQTFYDNIASQYDKFYLDWERTTHEEANFLNKIFKNNGYDITARILDCACGIGTQAIGLASLGYSVTGSDISGGEISEAKRRAANNNVAIDFKQADFCSLSDVFSEKFDIVIAMDNALPHMLTYEALEKAIKSIVNQMNNDGLFVASIRDYDLILKEKPAYSPPYIHKTDKGQRVLFQTWDWLGENYKFIQYIITDEETTKVSKFECEYRATRREEITKLLYENKCHEVHWEFPEKTGFYQPIVIAKK
jgi:2-polyprenyl-3-methyl-5-hydroxy-6-metoxy-1,4-benzoquinol methylase